MPGPHQAANCALSGGGAFTRPSKAGAAPLSSGVPLRSRSRRRLLYRSISRRADSRAFEILQDSLDQARVRPRGKMALRGPIDISTAG